MEKKKTAVFIDHESWFYGMVNLHEEFPNVENVLGIIEKDNEVALRRAFGNLPESLKIKEKEKLNKYGYDLEYTFEGNIKGDLTDFVVVDSIYRTLMSDVDIEKYIIISGDAHYLQVIRTIKDMGKEVELWGVVGTISAVFSEYNPKVIYPETNKEIVDKILEEVYISDALAKRMISPSIVKSVCDKYNFEEGIVKKVLNILISKGYIKEINYINTKGKRASCLTSNRELIKTKACI